jgi:hypothetical protein
VALVDLKMAASITGYSRRTLAKLFAEDKIEGERRAVERDGNTRHCIFVSVPSVFAYRHRVHQPRRRVDTAQPRVSEQELVCLHCVVPGDCDEDDPRCLYHHGRG